MIATIFEIYDINWDICQKFLSFYKSVDNNRKFNFNRKIMWKGLIWNCLIIVLNQNRLNKSFERFTSDKFL